MNKIILFSRSGLGLTAAELNDIWDALSASGFDWYINPPFARAIADSTGHEIPSGRLYEALSPALAEEAVMLSYGGDGTFLEAVRLAHGYDMPIAGINYGHLGFLSCTPRERMASIFEELRAERFEVQPRTMLRVSSSEACLDEHPYALNEFSIHRIEINMTYTDVFVDGRKLTTYRGDGVLISTPTGSTAYSLSVGGPIVDPMCGCFVIAPIAPHNLTMRPVVIPDTSEVTLCVNSRARHAAASLDNRSFQITPGTTFTVRKAEKPVFLANLQNISFYDTLRNKMMWGLDGWENGR